MILASDVIDSERLRAEIQAARARLQQRGFTLKAWAPPRKLGQSGREAKTFS